MWERVWFEPQSAGETKQAQGRVQHILNRFKGGKGVQIEGGLQIEGIAESCKGQGGVQRVQRI